MKKNGLLLLGILTLPVCGVVITKKPTGRKTIVINTVNILGYPLITGMDLIDDVITTYDFSDDFEKDRLAKEPMVKQRLEEIRQKYALLIDCDEHNIMAILSNDIFKCCSIAEIKLYMQELAQEMQEYWQGIYNLRPINSNLTAKELYEVRSVYFNVYHRLAAVVDSIKEIIKERS